MAVIGVTAPGYHGFDVGSRTDVLVPTMMKKEMTPTWNGLNERRVLWLQLVGRLKPGVTARQARASMEPYYHGVLIMELQSMPMRSERIRERFPQLQPPRTPGVDGFWIVAPAAGASRSIVIAGHDDRGVLYGTFALLRRVALQQPLAGVNDVETPSAPLRLTRSASEP